MTTAYPFLLACYDDYESQRLSAEDFLEVLRTLENFIIRRFVCGVPTNQLSKIFAPLSQQARELPVPFTEAVKDILEKRNYPKDFEFKRELVEAELYGAGDRGEKTKFILETLEESFGHKEQVAFDNLQVEHVMPQTLTDWWRSNLGENWKFTHETMCNTLGNLTLTAYNSELSNADFESKKRIYAGSHLELNRYFSEVETWREKDIRQRGEILAEKCLKIWSYFGKQNITNLNRQAEDEQVNTFETMNNGDFLVGEVLELFEALQDEVMRFNRAEEKILKQCVTYRVGNKTFLSVVPQKSGLKLYLNLPYEEVRNYTFCRDVTGIGHWGVGDVEVKIQEMQHIKEVMPIVRKAYERQLL
ncbi:MAG: DUF1524 domain-containing protein [Chloroherpetonaceae bacterium]|nr:DUF1524 domain-containing protein [Chloroherpetonaceae bacterium]